MGLGRALGRSGHFKPAALNNHNIYGPIFAALGLLCSRRRIRHHRVQSKTRWPPRLCAWFLSGSLSVSPIPRLPLTNLNALGARVSVSGRNPTLAMKTIG